MWQIWLKGGKIPPNTKMQTINEKSKQTNKIKNNKLKEEKNIPLRGFSLRR